MTLDVAQRRKPYIQHRQYEESEGFDESEPGFEMDYVYMSDTSQGSLDIKRGVRSRNTPKRSSSGNSSGAPRPKKMYELDVNLYPEAAAARASYENRVRKKAEKEQMISQLNFLTERNKVLEEENQVLKEKLLEYEMNVTARKTFHYLLISRVVIYFIIMDSFSIFRGLVLVFPSSWNTEWG